MRYSAGLAVIVVTLAASACTKEGSARDGAEAERQNAAYAEPATGTVGAASSTGTVSSSAATTIKVYKDPNCGCCNNWVEHLKENGFAVEAINESNMSAIKEKYAIGRG